MRGRGKLAIADKSYFLHERDEKGNLKSKIVEVEKGVEIELYPLQMANCPHWPILKRDILPFQPTLSAQKSPLMSLKNTGNQGK